METIVVLGVLVAASGCLQIVCRLRDLMWAHYLLKPLTMVLVIAVAWLLPGAEPGYRRLVLIGLVFSLAGDVFLMLPFDLFLYGLTAFLVGHCFYIAAFWGDIAMGGTTLVLAIGWGALGVAMLGYLRPGIGTMRLPVGVYMIVLMTMAWTASARSIAMADVGGLLALVGACLFVASDGLLAVDRFRDDLRWREPLVMGTYYSAQWFIACSVAWA